MKTVRFLTRMLLALPLLVARPARASTVSASAWSYEVQQSDTEPALASAQILRSGTPGSGQGHSAAAYGVLQCQSGIVGCGVPAEFQELCNNAGSSAGVQDTLIMNADLPLSWPAQVRVTLSISGEVNGRGGYSYDSRVWINGNSQAISGTTSGSVVLVDHLGLGDSRQFDIPLYVGSRLPLSHTLSTGALQRICAGGTQDCYDSANIWAIDLNAKSTVQIEILTQGVNAHLTSTSGHDYTQAVAGVAPGETAVIRLSPAWPNPAHGDVRLTLTLATSTRLDASVYDLAGRHVATLARGMHGPGTHTLSWNGRDENGTRRSGLFFVRAQGAGFTCARRAVIVR